MRVSKKKGSKYELWRCHSGEREANAILGKSSNETASLTEMKEGERKGKEDLQREGREGKAEEEWFVAKVFQLHLPEIRAGEG